MRRLITLLGFIVIATTIIVVAVASRGPEKAKAALAGPETFTTYAPVILQDPPGTIDGAITPELIPDDIAYSLFFKFVAGRRTDDEKNRLRFYLQQRDLDGIDVEALIRTADELQEADRALDNDQIALTVPPRDRSPAMEARVAGLKERKRALVNEEVALLPNRVGQNGAERVRRHVIEYMKRKIKIIPER